MRKENGAVMIETVIVFPIVLFTVFLLIYLGLFKLQEMAIIYQVQRVAHQGSMVLASPGYEMLGVYDAKQIDLATTPSDVDTYYRAYHDNLPVLYREIFGYGSWTSQDEMLSFLGKMAQDTLILAGVSSFDNNVTVQRGIFATGIDVQVTFSFPTLGVIKYFGYDDTLSFCEAASAKATNPAEMVRMVDLAGDAIVVISERLGIKNDLDKIMDGIRKYIF